MLQVILGIGLFDLALKKTADAAFEYRVGRNIAGGKLLPHILCPGRTALLTPEEIAEYSRASAKRQKELSSWGYERWQVFEKLCYEDASVMTEYGCEACRSCGRVHLKGKHD